MLETTLSLFRASGARAKSPNAMMKDHWLSLNDVIDLTGSQPQSVRRLAREGHVQSRPSERVRRNGRVQREYALSSLPLEAQLKFLKQPLVKEPDCTALALR